MPRPPENQYIVQHYHGDRYGWAFKDQTITTMADAVEAMLADGDDLSDPSLWLVERVERYGKTYIANVTLDAYDAALATMARRLRPEQLPDWHPAYLTPEAPIRSMADIVGGCV